MKMKRKYRFYSFAILLANILMLSHSVMFYCQNVDHAHLQHILLSYNGDEGEKCTHACCSNHDLCFHNQEINNNKEQKEENKGEGHSCGCCSHNGNVCALSLGFYGEEILNITVDLVALVPDNLCVISFDNYYGIINSITVIPPIDGRRIAPPSLRAPPISFC